MHEIASGLQIHSLMYRFHSSVKWKGGYPTRDQIVSQITQLWKRYGLEERTKFNTHVEKVYQDDKGRWIINNTSNGRFEGIVAAVGKRFGSLCHYSNARRDGHKVLRPLRFCISLSYVLYS